MSTYDEERQNVLRDKYAKIQRDFVRDSIYNNLFGGKKLFIGDVTWEIESGDIPCLAHDEDEAEELLKECDMNDFMPYGGNKHCSVYVRGPIGIDEKENIKYCKDERVLSAEFDFDMSCQEILDKLEEEVEKFVSDHPNQIYLDLDGDAKL